MEKNNQIKQQETEAIHYIDKHVIEPHKEQPTFQVQGFWQEVVLNFLKEKALIFVGKSLEHLKKQAISHLVDLSYWLLERLTDYLLTQYQNANQEEKELFLKKIKENFPESKLLKKLENL